jgi:molybdenum cofactor cytidylyltransferase
VASGRLMPMDSVAAIIVAAGSSSRLGQPKQLLMSDGERMLQRVVRMAKEAGASPVLVVLGAHREQIESHVDLSAVRIVLNPGWEEGMGTSIRAGLQALEEQAPKPSGVLLMVCDQPALTAEHLGRMLDAFRQDPQTTIASVYAYRRGVPAIFPQRAFADLLALRGDQGARGLLLEAGRTVTEITLESGELDIDLPADLNHLSSS